MATLNGRRSLESGAQSHFSNSRRRPRGMRNGQQEVVKEARSCFYDAPAPVIDCRRARLEYAISAQSDLGLALRILLLAPLFAFATRLGRRFSSTCWARLTLIEPRSKNKTARALYFRPTSWRAPLATPATGSRASPAFEFSRATRNFPRTMVSTRAKTDENVHASACMRQHLVVRLGDGELCEHWTPGRR